MKSRQHAIDQQKKAPAYDSRGFVLFDEASNKYSSWSPQIDEP
jgi:hypothetical protein